MKIFTWLWLLLFILQIAACEKITSQQAQAFINMRKAICQGGSLASAKPFVTEGSKAALDFTQALMPLAQIFTGERMDDALAKDCQNTPKVINQIKVNDKRYLIQFTNSSEDKVNEIAVVLENGQWKVQLFGLFSGNDDSSNGSNQSNKTSPIIDREAGVHPPIEQPPDSIKNKTIAALVDEATAGQSKLQPCPESRFFEWHNCLGAVTYPDGSKYVGDFANNKRDGHGTFIFPSGEKYAGEFVGDMYNGLGTWVHPTGSKYTGGWQNGKFHGSGTLINANSPRVEGTWNNGGYVF